MLRAEVRDVVALDPDRQRVHPERLAQVVERIHPLLAAALGAQLVLLDREPRVALGQLVQAALLAALRVAQLDRRRRGAPRAPACTTSASASEAGPTISPGIESDVE